jgi:hypothetical protein
MVEQKSARAEQTDDCTHHWRIASPSGETSTGVCQICGASREFQNYAQRSSMSLLRKPSANKGSIST